MFLASIISDNVASVAEVGGLSATVILPLAFWLRKHGRARIVSWFREALSHGSSDGALLTIGENNKVAADIHKDIKDIGARLYLSELAMNARLDMHDVQTDRLEAGLKQLTSVLLRDPRVKFNDSLQRSEANGAQ
jgi:hypothetical protein